MYVVLFAFLVAVASTINGHPLDVHPPQNVADYFGDNRIVGGEDAPKQYGTYMAALVYSYDWVLFICGGSIITLRHILSAAHCIDIMVTWHGHLMPSFRATVGSKQWLAGSTPYEFSGYVLHPEWDWNTIKNDIGVLEVSKNIQISASVTILPLKFDWVDGGTRAYVTGWGLTSNDFDEAKTLQLLYVNTLTHKECDERMRQTEESEGSMPPISEQLEICTLVSEGKGMCNGDSGSALVQSSDQMQIGIVSWGQPCARGVPDVFVRLSGFEHFVRSNTRGYVR